MADHAPLLDLNPFDPINFNLPDPGKKPITNIFLIEKLFPLPPDVSFEKYQPPRKNDESQVVKPSLGRVVVHGYMEREKKKPVGKDWKDRLDQEIVKNLSNEIFNLKQLQTWIFSMIENNYSGIVVANHGCRKTIGFLLPLIEKVRIKSHQSHMMCDVVYWESEPTPYALIVTATEPKALHIMNQAKWLARGTGVYVRHADGSQMESTEWCADQPSTSRSNIVIGTASHVMQFLKSSKADLHFVETLVFTECEKLDQDPSYSQELEHLQLQLQKDNQSYFHSNSGSKGLDCVIMTYNDWRGKMAENLKKFIRNDEEFSAVYLEGATIYRNGPSYKVIQCNASPEQMFRYKISYLNGLIKKVQEENTGERRTRRKCVIITSNKTNANYIAAFLTVTHEPTPFAVITEDSDAISVENVRVRVRNGETDFMVCDYTGITFLEPGYIDYVAMFAMPPMKLFDQKMMTIKKLSSMISHKSCFVFFDPLKDANFAPKLSLLMAVSLQRVPVSLWKLACEREAETKAALGVEDVNSTK